MPVSPPTNLASNGRVFFESQDVLSPQDADGGVQDVYEWEPVGVGGCTRAAGCISLISGGRGSESSWFLDATASSGDDAFFITRDQLLRSDRNEQLDLYDARVGGGFEEGESTPCGGEGCRGASAPSGTASAPASSELSGPGNEKSKHKKKKHKKKHKKKKQVHGKKGNVHRKSKSGRGGSR
jgi:hypothetical protein